MFLESKVTFEHFFFSTNQQSTIFWPIVAETVFPMSMLAHLLQMFNDGFKEILFFGHHHFRCYTTFSFLSKSIICQSGANFYAESWNNTHNGKIRCAITDAINFEKSKNRFLTIRNSATEWLEQKKLIKIFCTKNNLGLLFSDSKDPFIKFFFCAFALNIGKNLYLYLCHFEIKIPQLYYIYYFSVWHLICAIFIPIFQTYNKFEGVKIEWDTTKQHQKYPIFVILTVFESRKKTKVDNKHKFICIYLKSHRKT